MPKPRNDGYLAPSARAAGEQGPTEPEMQNIRKSAISMNRLPPTATMHLRSCEWALILQESSGWEEQGSLPMRGFVCDNKEHVPGTVRQVERLVSGDMRCLRCPPVIFVKGGVQLLMLAAL